MEKSQKIKTHNQSIEFLQKLIQKYNEISEIIDFRNHREYVSDLVPENKKAFRFTVKLISANFINDLVTDPRVSHVFYAASHAPPGGALDSISLRYKIYVIYN